MRPLADGPVTSPSLAAHYARLYRCPSCKGAVKIEKGKVIVDHHSACPRKARRRGKRGG